jgi:hypothetical protein
VGVVYIGDKAVGKTHLAVELTNPQGRHVRADLLNQTYENLKANLLYPDGKARQTIQRVTRPMTVKVKLKTGWTEIPVDWIDCNGEMFHPSWQSKDPQNAKDWQDFLSQVRQSEGILLIIPPYREMVAPGNDLDEFITQQQWCTRFQRWVDFFIHDCPKTQQIAICLNKADLIVQNLEQEAAKMAYDPDGRGIDWFDIHNYIVNYYFRPITSQLAEINQSRSGLSVRCFITSIYNRTLLELPWIYLANYLDD